MQISKRLQEMEVSPVRKFTPYADEARAKGKKIYGLNIGQPDIKTPKTFFEAIKNFDTEVVAYVNSRGDDRLIAAVQRYYKRLGLEFEKNEIVITEGGSEALMFLMLSILNEGDEVLMAEPFYANYKTFYGLAGGKLVGIPTTAEEGYQYADRERIEKCITDKTKAFVVVNPNNPTGKVLSHDEMKLIVDICLEHDLYLVCDEVYREFVYDGKEMSTFGQFKEAEQNIIIIDSVSKRFSACGARIGTVCSKNKEVMAEMLKLCQGRLSASMIEQVGCAELYDMDPSYFDEIKAEYEHRRNVTIEALNEIEGIKYGVPEGAFYMTCHLPVDDAEKLLLFLLKDFDIDGETVMYAPARGFHVTPGAGYSDIRIAYVLNADDMKKAINILKEGIKAYNALNK